jgi:hypothetical protein
LQSLENNEVVTTVLIRIDGSAYGLTLVTTANQKNHYTPVTISATAAVSPGSHLVAVEAFASDTDMVSGLVCGWAIGI